MSCVRPSVGITTPLGTREARQRKKQRATRLHDVAALQHDDAPSIVVQRDGRRVDGGAHGRVRRAEPRLRAAVVAHPDGRRALGAAVRVGRAPALVASARARFDRARGLGCGARLGDLFATAATTAAATSGVER